jgi:hypothetical protein
MLVDHEKSDHVTETGGVSSGLFSNAAGQVRASITSIC